MTSSIFETIKKVLEAKGEISQDVRDMLILSGIIELYSEIDTVKDEIKGLSNMVPLYRILVAIGGILLTLFVGLLWSIFTGQVKITF